MDRKTIASLSVFLAGTITFAASALPPGHDLHAHQEMPAPVWPDRTVASLGATGANFVPLINGATGPQAAAAPYFKATPFAGKVMGQAGEIITSVERPLTRTG